MAFYGCDYTVICTKCGQKLFSTPARFLDGSIEIGEAFIKCPRCGKEVFNRYVKEFECLNAKQQAKLIPHLQKISPKEGKRFFLDGTYVICEETVVESIIRTLSKDYCEKLVSKGFTITKCDHSHVYIGSEKCTLQELENKGEI